MFLLQKVKDQFKINGVNNVLIFINQIRDFTGFCATTSDGSFFMVYILLKHQMKIDFYHLILNSIRV